MDDLIPLADLQRAAGKWVKRAKEAKHPLLITERGRPLAYLVALPLYEEMLASRSHKERSQEGRYQILLRELAKMLPIIIKEYAPEKIILFGSLATGDVKEGSDIDLLIIKKTKKRPLERRKELLNLVQPTIATDFFVYTPDEFLQSEKEERPFIMKEVHEKGKVLYDASVASS